MKKKPGIKPRPWILLYMTSLRDGHHPVPHVVQEPYQKVRTFEHLTAVRGYRNCSMLIGAKWLAVNVISGKTVELQ